MRDITYHIMFRNQPKQQEPTIQDIFKGLADENLDDLVSGFMQSNDIIGELSKALAGSTGSCCESSCESQQANPMQELISDIMKKVAPTQQPCTPKKSDDAVPTFEYEIRETLSSMEVYVDIPGVEKSDIYVTYECMSDEPSSKKTLNITCERKPREGHTVTKSTVKYGKRALCLLLKKASQSITIEDITAKYENGILCIVLPKELESPSVKTPKYVHIS